MQTLQLRNWRASRLHSFVFEWAMKTCLGGWPIIFSWGDFGKLLVIVFRAP